MESIQILIADDHLNVRAQVRARLSREPGFQIVGEAANSAEAVACALAAKPQIVIIDPVMRDGSGIQALYRIAADLPNATIIVLTAVADTALTMELRKAGAHRIFDKGIASQELVDLIQKIARANLSSNGGENTWK